MATNRTFFLTLLILLASLLSANSVEYIVTNDALNLPGGQCFENLLGTPWTIDLMDTINQFIWRVFEQPDNTTRKYVPVLNAYISDFTWAMGYKNGDNVNISAEAIAGWKPEATKFWFTSLMYHEMTHVFQYFGTGNETGTAPGGLTEGVADYVMIKSGYYDPTTYTKPGAGNQWDEGYGITARFLEYCDTLRPGFTAALNNMMRDVYNESYFQDLLGKPVSQLWEEYKEKFSSIQADSRSSLSYTTNLA